MVSGIVGGAGRALALALNGVSAFRIMYIVLRSTGFRCRDHGSRCAGHRSVFG